MPPDRDEAIQKFVENLAKLSPGDRAKLKRSAGKTLAESYRVAPLFFRILPPTVGRYYEDRYFLLATLYPLAPSESWNSESERQNSLGATLRMLRDDNNAQALNRRFEVLIDADLQQLPYHLRQMVRRIGNKEIPVQWEQLLSDLLAWTHPSRYVQLRWARDYFRSESVGSDDKTDSDDYYKSLEDE